VIIENKARMATSRILRTALLRSSHRTPAIQLQSDHPSFCGSSRTMRGRVSWQMKKTSKHWN